MPSNSHTPASQARFKFAVPLVVAAVAVLSGIVYWGGGELSIAADSVRPSNTEAQARSGAPAFQAVSLSGRQISFPEDYRGQLVLLDFWATWCGPCRTEFPHLREAYGRFRDRGFEILGISLDASAGIRAASVRQFLRDNQARWEVVYDDASDIAGPYGVRAIPAMFLVDGDSGRIVATGDELRGGALLRTIEDALRAKSSR
jgi:thiol-disulfide isomerase/thioredoxin